MADGGFGDEHDDIGVLLDGARLAEVGHAGLAGLVLGLSVELGQGDDRDLELLGHGLDATGDLGDLLFAGQARVQAVDKLDVVDDHHVQGGAGMDAAALGPDLQDVLAAVIVDHEGQSFVLVGGLDEVDLHAFIWVGGAKLLHIHAGARAEQTQGQFAGWHFEGEQQHVGRLAGLVGLGEERGFDEVEGDGSLTHARAGGDDDHLAGLEAKGHRIEIGEARGHALHRVTVADDALDELHRLGDGSVNRLRGFRDAIFADAEEGLLDLFKEALDAFRVRVRLLDRRDGGRDELS